MAIIFLSYRRDDSEDVAGRIYDELIKHFDRSDVFMDVDSIPDGADFVKIIQDQVRECQVMLLVIGRNWIGQLPTRKRRIDDPNDFVRLEVHAALQRGMPIIPLLVSRATMPTPADLPEPLRHLTRLNARQVRPNPDFHRDMERVIAAVETQRAVWLAAEQEREREREEQARKALEAARNQGASHGAATDPGSLDTADTSDTDRNAQLMSWVGTATRYTMGALRVVLTRALVGAIIFALLAAVGTIGVSYWLTHQFPPRLPTYLAAGWSALTTGGLAAAIIALIEILSSLIRAIELIIQEAEHMVTSVAVEAVNQLEQSLAVDTVSVPASLNEPDAPQDTEASSDH